MSKIVKTKKLTKHQEEKVNQQFEAFKLKKYSDEDLKKLFDNEAKIMGKTKDKNLKGFTGEIKLFFLMLKDFFTRKYTQIPVGTIVAIAGTLLYILAPFDVIPDWIPGMGYLDDGGIIILCLKAFKYDIDKYKAFIGISE